MIDAIVAIEETVKTAAETLATALFEEFDWKHRIRLVEQKYFIH